MSRSVAALLVSLAAVTIPAAAAAQCESNEDCRYGRECIDGRCAYADEGSCDTDTDCPDGSICEGSRCVQHGASQTPPTPAGPLLPPPQPGQLRDLRTRRTDGGARFVDPIEWGGRGAISPRPRGTSTFEFQYGAGEIPCLCCSGLDEQTDVNSMQLILGGDSIIANIVNLGFTMALFRWTSLEACEGDVAEQFSVGDIQMRVSVLAYRNTGANHWFGLTPYVRLMLSTTGTQLLGNGGVYRALFEPGVASGFAVGMFSAAINLSGIIGLTEDETIGMFLSHLTVGVRPVPILALIADLEIGYGLPGDKDAVPVAALLGLRFFLGRMIALDLSTRLAATEAARYSDANAAVGFWSIGTRLSVVWRGMGRP